ncbi:MAG: PHP domain-containing protein [Spirochaetales bacterium]|jgi:histidinol-phosphatase (PHP family)|nr:PHP domain-containing protein [Spirochaetales bacterium]
MYRENFHTHTYRCHHAMGDAADYAGAAREAGLTRLGISDHTPLPDGWTPEIRMDMGELQDYLQAIRQAGETQGILVIAGMECDLNRRYFGFYERELLAPGRCRYLIGALHYYTHKSEEIYAGLIPGAAYLASYAKTIVSGIESGLFAFIAHPDHFAAGWNRWDSETKACVRAIMEAAKGAGIPLEINGNGFRKSPVNFDGKTRPPYPWTPFWEMAAEYGVSCICNSDAHRPQDVTASLDRCEKLAAGLGLKKGTARLLDE